MKTIKKTTKEYESEDNVDITFQAIRRLGIARGPRSQFDAVTTLLSDNRELFRKLFGPPSFHFRGEFYFHGRCFEFEDGIYWVLTAKTKGTCYEGKSGFGDRDERFMRSMLETLKN